MFDHLRRWVNEYISMVCHFCHCPPKSLDRLSSLRTKRSSATIHTHVIQTHFYRSLPIWRLRTELRNLNWTQNQTRLRRWSAARTRYPQKHKMRCVPLENHMWTGVRRAQPRRIIAPRLIKYRFISFLFHLVWCARRNNTNVSVPTINAPNVETQRSDFDARVSERNGPLADDSVHNQTQPKWIAFISVRVWDTATTIQQRRRQQPTRWSCDGKKQMVRVSVATSR